MKTLILMTLLLSFGAWPSLSWSASPSPDQCLSNPTLSPSEIAALPGPTATGGNNFSKESYGAIQDAKVKKNLCLARRLYEFINARLTQGEKTQDIAKSINPKLVPEVMSDYLSFDEMKKIGPVMIRVSMAGGK